MSPLFISSVKVISSDSGEKSALIMHCIQAKTAVNKYVDGFCYERTTEDGVFVF